MRKSAFFFFFFWERALFVHLSVGLCEVYADRPLPEAAASAVHVRGHPGGRGGSMSHFLELKVTERGFDSYSVQRRFRDLFVKRCCVNTPSVFGELNNQRFVRILSSTKYHGKCQWSEAEIRLAPETTLRWVFAAEMLDKKEGICGILMTDLLHGTHSKKRIQHCKATIPQ